MADPQEEDPDLPDFLEYNEKVFTFHSEYTSYLDAFHEAESICPHEDEFHIKIAKERFGLYILYKDNSEVKT